MLGYVTGGERGQADLLLAEVAAELRRAGLSVAGVVLYFIQPSGKIRSPLNIPS